MPDNLTALGIRKGSSGQTWRGFDVAEKGNHWKFTIEKLNSLMLMEESIGPLREDGPDIKDSWMKEREQPYKISGLTFPL